MIKKHLAKPEYVFLFNIVKENKKSAIVVLLFSFLSALIGLVGPYLLKLQIDQLQHQYNDLFSIVYTSPVNVFLLLITVTILFQLLSRLFDRWAQVHREKLGQKLAFSSEKKLYEKYETFDAGFLANPRNRRISQSIFQITFLAEDVLSFWSQTVSEIIAVVGILPIIAQINVSIFFVILVATILQAIYSRRQMRLENQERLFTEKLDARRYELRYTLLSKFHQLVAIGGQTQVLQEYLQLMQASQQQQIERTKRSNKRGLFESLFSQIPYWIARMIIGTTVLIGRASIGDFTALTLYTDQLSQVFFSAVNKSNQWQRVSLNLNKIGFFLNLKPRYSLPAQSLTLPLNGSIKFNRVIFRYPNLDQDEKKYLQYLLNNNNRLSKNSFHNKWDKSEMQEWENLLVDAEKELPQVLNGITLECKQGEITALIGRNGSGKTTATHLLVRNYDPESGTVLIGDQVLTHFTPNHVRQYVSIISQEPLLLEDFSIRDNLLLGVETALTDDQIWKLLERLDLANTIKNLPKGLESLIGDEIRLSGGQAQLLMVGRVFLQHRPIIIFDEGTNQLDAEHESLVTGLLEEIKEKSTILLITHKMTTARKADQIYVLDKGKVIGSGSHHTLLKQKGLYEKFWNLQVVD